MTATLEPAQAPAPAVVSRNALMRLPTDVKQRLRDVPQHVHALQTLLATTDEDGYVRAATRGDPRLLAAVVYPLQRAVDVLCGHVCELAAIAVHRNGTESGDAQENLRVLAAIGATTPLRTEELIAVCAARATLSHPQDEDELRLFARAAATLERIIVPFLAEYTTWLLAQPPRDQ